MSNLSEEEKKAIEIVKEIPHNHHKEIFMSEDLAIAKVLNLIEKQNKEIENLKNLNKHQSKDMTKAVDYTFELNKEIEIKDKMIDVMADSIAYNAKIHEGDPAKVKEYFRKKAENE